MRGTTDNMLALREVVRAVRSRLTRTASSNSSNRMNSRGEEETTVNRDELDRFAVINDWWNPKAKSVRGLWSMNELRVPLIKDALLKRPLTTSHDNVTTPLDGYTILDVGCGAGLLCEVGGLQPSLVAHVNFSLAAFGKTRSTIERNRPGCQQHFDRKGPRQSQPRAGGPCHVRVLYNERPAGSTRAVRRGSGVGGRGTRG